MLTKTTIAHATAFMGITLSLLGSAAAQPRPAAAPSPLERFATLPADRQEEIRNEIQPLFFRSMQSNGRLIRMEQDCGLPLPTEATPAARLEADLQNPGSATGKLFGPNRQGALLARLRGAMQATIDCRQAAEMRPELIQQLRSFPRELQTVLDRSLAGTGQSSAPATPRPQASDMRAAPIPGVAPGTGPANPATLPKLVIGAPGTCELATGGHPQTCISGLIYVQSREGAVLLSVQSAPRTTIGFQGNSDSQVRPEHYTLNLNRLHSSVDGRTASKSVTGTCEIDMTADGQTWHRATCRARDGNGLETVMTYTGNGRAVTATHPGDDASKAPAPNR